MEKNISIWDSIYKNNTFVNIDQFPSKQLQAFVLHHIKTSNIKNPMLLEIGCGIGISTKYLSDFVSFIEAIDASETCISKARKINSKNCNFHVADYRDLSFLEDNYFDFISSEAVIYYGDKTSFIKGVNEIYKKLKIGGIARIYTKSNNDTYSKNSGKPINLEQDTYMIIDPKKYEFGLTVYMPDLNSIKGIFSNFKDIKIGIEEFNHIDLDIIHSYWIITCTK